MAAVLSMKPTASAFFTFLVLPRGYFGEPNGSRVARGAPLLHFPSILIKLNPWDSRTRGLASAFGGSDYFWSEAES